MSLLSDIQSYINDGGNLFTLTGNDGIGQERGPEFVTDSRWFTYWEIIFSRNGEYVGVTYAEGATEMQDADDEELDVYAVVPRQVTQTVYERV